MGEWQEHDEEDKPPMGMISMSLGEIDWEDMVSLSLPREIVELMTNIVGQIGLGSIQQITDTSYALVSSEQGDSLAQLLAAMLKGPEGEAKPPG